MHTDRQALIHQAIASELAIDCAEEVSRIEAFLVQTTARQLNRRGLVLGVSGGIDSAVCATLATRAVGRERVFALLMPERESSSDATERARCLCDSLGIGYAIEDISEGLAGIGCYDRRDEALRRLFPDYGPGWRHKIALTAVGNGRIPRFDVIVETPEGRQMTKRLPTDIYLQLVAATNFKQRLRKNLEYFHAERLNYAVLGTPNRLEYELGFFVRGGDGLADVKPIAHLFKTQVYAVAEYLGVPEEIRRQPPSTDTYSLPQTQEEFYFALSYDRADVALHGLANGLAAEQVAPALGLSAEQTREIFRDFDGKRRVAARSLRQALVLADRPNALRQPEPTDDSTGRPIPADN